MAAETIIESFCERCGTRYTFEPAKKRESKLVGIGKTLGILLEDHSAALAARDPFHGTFHFCLGCRQYTCPRCWNEPVGFCIGCQPLPGLADDGLADAEAAAELEAIDLADRAAAEHAMLAPANAWPDADLHRDSAPWPPEPEPEHDPWGRSLPPPAVEPDTPTIDLPILLAVPAAVDAEPEPMAEAEVQVEPELPAEAEAEVQVVLVSEADPMEEPELLAEAEPELPAEAEAEVQVEPELLAEPELPAEAEAEVQVEPELLAEAEAEAEVVLMSEADPMAEVEAEPVAEPEVVAEAMPEPQLMAVPEPVAASESETAAEPGAEVPVEVEPVADDDMATEADLVAAPVADDDMATEADLVAAPAPELAAETPIAAAFTAAAVIDAAAEPASEADVDPDGEADWADLLRQMGERSAEPEPAADEWSSLAPSLGPDIAQEPYPLPAVVPSPPVHPAAAPAWQLTAPAQPEPEPARDAWRPLGPVFRQSAPAAPPAAPHPSLLGRPSGPTAMPARGASHGAAGAMPSGVRPCVSCELPLSAHARFCRRCGRPQA